MLLHEVGENAGVGGEAGKGEAEVLVDSDYFFLVRGEFFCVALGRRSACSEREGWKEGELEGMVNGVPSELRGLRVSC